MKKFIASVGLVAVGTATLSAQYAPGLTRMETTKPWSLSGSLRGFYDDNINTQPSDFKVESWGMEFSPAAALNFSAEQTYLRLGYVYSLRWFEETGEVDHSHEFDALLEHRFSERFKLNVSDSFVYAQEPDVVSTIGGVQSTFVRAGNVIRNRAGADVTAQVTEKVSVDVAYSNSYYDYQKSPYSEELNRFEHRISLDGGYLITEKLTGLVGYTYGINDYTSGQNIPGTTIKGSDRNNTSHYLYGGLKQALTSKLSGSVKVGGQYTDYEKADSTWSPYADLNLTYNYLQDSSIQVGFTHDRNATDIIGAVNNNDFVLDQESSMVYAQLTHAIDVNLIGSLLGKYQNSSFNGGAFNDDVDNYFAFGANLEYKFTQHVSTELGYNFDRDDSDIAGRSFSRNRVYFGVRASY